MKPAKMQIGDIITQVTKCATHTYKFLGRTDTHRTGYNKFEGRCSECGALFICIAFSTAKGYLNRRCGEHAHAGCYARRAAD